MGYDVSVGEWDGNYTHNSLGAVCYSHLDANAGLRSLDGLRGYEAAPFLAAFWKRVYDEKNSLWDGAKPGEPDLCKKYDSPNGWGSLVGALIFMGELTAACALYPQSKIEVNA